MRLILDTNEYIFGFDLSSRQSASIKLLKKIEELLNEIRDFQLFVPDIIRDEVQRNMPSHLLSHFYRFIVSDSKIIQASVLETPITHFNHYHLELGLKEADATIAAFADWNGVDILVSENRHFLSLKVDKFAICNAEDFIQQFEKSEM